MDSCFVVVRDGGYINNVFGPFSDEESAEGVCAELKAQEPDDYHLLSVCKMSVALGLFGEDGQRT